MLFTRLLLSVCFLVFSLSIGLALSPEKAAHFVRYYGYYFVALAGGGFVVYWGLLLLASCRRYAGQRSVMKPSLIGLCVTLLGSVFVFHGSDLDYKILMDDYLLSATAKSLHETGQVAVAEFGREIDGQFVVVQSFVDKRPWFFPFVVSVAHDVFGYNPLHPFGVNAALTVIFLGVVFAIGYSLAGVGGAALSVLLWASLPLLQQNATGGGMEMMNLLMIHIVMMLSICYLRSPTAQGEGALCLAGVLLTYSRYESGLFLGAILIVIVLGWLREKRIFLSLPAMCAAPLLIALFLQTRIYAATESSWEMAEGVSAPFSLSNMWSNVPHVFAFLWSRDFAIANSLLLGAIALPAVLGLIGLCFWQRNRDWWRKPANQVWVIFAIFLLINLMVILTFHAAQFDKRYVARYSLPAHGLIVFSTIACLAVVRRRTWAWAVSIGLTVVFLLGVTWPKNGQALYTKANFMVAEQHWLEAIDASFVASDTLVLDRFYSVWTLRERSALPPHVALAHIERVKEELEVGKYGQVLLVERLAETLGVYRSQLPSVEGLRQAFDSELLAEKSFRAGTLTRIYRLNP